jgi:hypothetical protein
MGILKNVTENYLTARTELLSEGLSIDLKKREIADFCELGADFLNSLFSDS